MRLQKNICVHTYTLSNPIIRFVSIFNLIQKCLLHFLRFTQRSRVVYHSRYLSLSCTVCLACYFLSSMKVVTQGKEIITLVARAWKYKVFRSLPCYSWTFCDLLLQLYWSANPLITSFHPPPPFFFSVPRCLFAVHGWHSSASGCKCFTSRVWYEVSSKAGS